MSSFGLDSPLEVFDPYFLSKERRLDQARLSSDFKEVKFLLRCDNFLSRGVFTLLSTRTNLLVKGVVRTEHLRPTSAQSH